MEAAAKKEAEEAARKKAAAEEAAKVEAARLAAEADKLALLGVDDLIKELQQKIETETSKAALFTYNKQLEKALVK